MKNNSAYGSLAPFLPVDDAVFPLDQQAVFGRTAPLEVEIGFGTGEYLVRAAAAAPEKDFIGLEQCARRILATLRKIKGAGTGVRAGNIRVMRMDAVWAFRFLFKERSLARVHCLFPCPWPKKRHAKNRLFTTEFLRVINGRLIDGAELYIVTDHKPYAAWITEHAEGSGFALRAGIIPARFGTKFERKWFEAGQSSFYEISLTKTQHQVTAQEGVAMKAYLFDEVDLDNIRLEDLWGPVTVKFGAWLHDPRLKKAMVDAVVSEDGRVQHVWIVVAPARKGWSVAPAAGTVVLPTLGVQQALDRVAEAVRLSVAGAK